MSSPREFMDCRYCNETTGHTRTAGCIIAVERAAAVNEVTQPGHDQWGRPTVPIDREQLARDIIALAQVGGMPNTYWHSDSRIARACSVLGISPDEAREMELPDDDDL